MNLINLLPKEIQEKRKREIRLKFLINFYIFWGTIFLFVLFVLLLLWGRFYFLLQGERELLAEIQTKSFQIQNLEREIKEINRDLQKINQFWKKKIFVSDILKNLEGVAFDKIKILEFYFDRKNNQGELEGVASNISDLDQLRKDLKSLAIFSDFSIELVGEIQKENIQFKLRFQL